MRILHLDGARSWAGGQNQVRLLMHGLAAHGIEQLCVCPAGSPLAARLLAENLPVYAAAWQRGFDPKAVLAVLFRAGAWDLIHAHDTHALQIGLIAGLTAGIPVIASRRVRFRTRPFTWNRADRVIAVSEAVRTHILKSGVATDRVVTIHDGVDLAELLALPPAAPTLRETLGLPADAFLAGTVGTLLEYKHQERLAEAAAVASREITWVIIGDGPQRETIEKRCAELGVTERVHLTGRLPDARRILRELDVFVFPSIGEALGTSVLDAMALSVPVVAADDAGPAEVLAPVHAKTRNTLVPPTDASALARAVEQLRDDAALRLRAITLQLQRVEEFSIDRTVKETLALYATVLNE